jgi:hypothetical protein
MPHKNHITSAAEVIQELGGEQNLAAMFDVHHKAVANWKYFGIFPASTYVTLKNMLKKRGKTAPDELWAMRGPKR